MLRPDDIADTRTGSGPPMILIHGVPATSTLWAPVVPELSRHHTVYALDLPGFGGTPPPDDPIELTLPRLVASILGFATHHRLDRFDLVGHSFGGAVAAAVAAEAPERVATLTLIAPMGVDMPPPVRLARTALVRRVVAPAWRYVPRRLRRAIVRFGTRLNYGPAYITARAVEVAAELDRADALEAICAIVGAFDFDEYARRIDRLGTLTIPMLMIGAGRDRVVPFAHFESLRARLPNAQELTYDDGVHVVMWQYTEPIARRLVAFVEAQESPR